MKILDISREFFTASVYPGDPQPERKWLKTIGENGAECNFSYVQAGSHIATHLDAPYHFVAEGCTMESLPLETFMGPCSVRTAAGVLSGEETRALLESCPKGTKRLLIRGNAQAFYSEESGPVLQEYGVALVGTDSQTIGDVLAHRSILSRGIAALEGLDFSGVEDGDYLLIALPLKIDGAEGTFTRAVLLQNA